ncbi:MAG: SDR family NAD(P)-dependent oxidoreductase [Pseudomonadota bacterium]
MDVSTAKVVVTGAAQGLGWATARAFADAGAQVTVLDINEAAGNAAAESIGAAFFAADVTDETSVSKALDKAADAMGGLSVAVNCAGIALGEKTLGRDGPHRIDSFRRTVDINLTGSFNLLRLSARIMADETPNPEGERGVIINTASVAAFDGQKGQAAYAASKAGIAGLSLPAARDLARDGIRVMAIAPGVFETPMLNGLGPEITEALAADVLFPKRLGRPAEFAALALFIVSCPYLNATTIRLDAGLRLP